MPPTSSILTETKSLAQLQPCEVCNDLIVAGIRTRLEDDIAVLKLNEVRRQCRFCSLITSMISHFTEPYGTESIYLEADEGHAIQVEITPFHLEFSANGDKALKFLPTIRFIVYSADHCPILTALEVVGLYKTRVDLQSSVAFIRRKLDECLDSHAQCPGSRDSLLPKRIIRVGRVESEPLRLVESGATLLHGRYATLSYCWGGDQPLKTTRANLDRMLSSISKDDLPIMFRDAISLVRELGIDFIWIDSLCIVQDNRQDWELESVKMCEYYSNSYLNIAVATSPNPGVPVFGERDPKWTPVAFPLKQGASRSYTIFAKRERPGEDITEQGVLFSRAWAWQEAALARRTIHFTVDKLVWQCWKDVTPDFYAPPPLISGPMGSDYMYGPDGPSSTTDAESVYDWHLIVTSYSPRRLTYPDDRLPALSGATARFYKKTGWNYLAGLWDHDLPHHLCWQLAFWKIDVLSCQSHEYISPSWSWASLMQPVWYSGERWPTCFSSGVTVVDVYCQVPGLNPFGKVTGAYLRLRGRMKEIQIQCSNPLNYRKYKIDGCPDWEFVPDCVLVEDHGRVMPASEQQTASDFSGAATCIYLGEKRLLDSDGDKDDERLFALVLAEVATEENKFKRLGLATTRDLKSTMFEDADEQEIVIV